MKRWTRVIALILGSAATACVTMAPPPPIATLGGPETARPGHAEVALGGGGGASLFAGAHSGGEALFGRYRRGLADKLDLGLDVMAGQHGQYVFLTAKVAARYRIAEHVRLEVGLGAADDSLGKGLSVDTAVTVGTAKADAIWNYYSALRVLFAYGFPPIIDGNGGASTAPPNDLIAVITVGTSGRTSRNGQIVFEGGMGPEFVRGQGVGIALYLGGAVLFDIGPLPQGGIGPM